MSDEIDKTAEILDSQPSDLVQDFKLSRPVMVAGTEYTALHLDFTNLTGEDSESIEAAMMAEGNQAMLLTPVKAFSQAYLIRVIALAAKLPPQVIRKLPLNDINRLTLIAQRFLMQSD